MGLKDKLGFSAFQKRPAPPPIRKIENLPRVHADYGELCGRIHPNLRDEWCERGIRDFPELCAVPGVAEVGVNLEYSRLHVLTDSIHARDHEGKWRTIGELIVTYFAVTKTMTIESVTGGRRREDNKWCAHPHVMSGVLCYSARTELMQLFLDAHISAAMQRLIPCLQMDPSAVELQNAYHGLENWPLMERG